jgi:CRISPR/Cas system CMR-associated protein Cmr5 small subunit
MLHANCWLHFPEMDYSSYVTWNDFFPTIVLDTGLNKIILFLKPQKHLNHKEKKDEYKETGKKTTLELTLKHLLVDWFFVCLFCFVF